MAVQDRIDEQMRPRRQKGKRPSPAGKPSLRSGEFARVAGTPVGYKVEHNADPLRIDHLTIMIRAGDFGAVEIALNTFSVRNLKAGFDPRVQLALFPSTWSALPPLGMSPSGGLDYARLEDGKQLYQEYERPALETLLIAKIDRAVLIEGWGEFYLRRLPGIHQVHSRRANRAVSTDYVGRDGAIRFYFQENTAAELSLFKFFGQP